MNEKQKAQRNSANPFNSERLLELYQTNPTVHNCLGRWLIGEMSYEKALESCISLLVQQNEQLAEELSRSPRIPLAEIIKRQQSE